MKNYIEKRTPYKLKAIQYTGKNLKEIKKYRPEAQQLVLELDRADQFLSGNKTKRILIVKTYGYREKEKDTIVQIRDYSVWHGNNTFSVIEQDRFESDYKTN